MSWAVPRNHWLPRIGRWKARPGWPSGPSACRGSLSSLFGWTNRASPRSTGSKACKPRKKGVLLLLADPFSFRVEELLKRFNQQVPGLRVVGGMASGSQVPRANQLVLDGKAFPDGAVAMFLDGGIKVGTVVSQGCRPIGRTMIVTRAENNVIRELGRRPALDALREMFQELSAEDQRRIQDGLHIGRVINEYQATFQRGDFLVRNVMGADDSGAIQINDLVRVGQTVQFHVRDAETADEDLREHLLLAREQSPGCLRSAWRLAVHLQRPGHPALRRTRSRCHADSRGLRANPHRRLLRDGRARPGRRPELPPRLHGQCRPFERR